MGPLRLSLDKPTEVNLRLGRGGSIEGRILDLDGEPVCGISVFASMRSYFAVASATPNRHGKFRLRGLAPGVYTLGSLPVGGVVSDLVAYLRTRFLGMPDGTRGSEIAGWNEPRVTYEVNEGKPIRGITMTLKTGAETVSGRVTAPGGQALSGVFVWIRGVSGFSYSARTDKDGGFGASRVPSGEVSVEVVFGNHRETRRLVKGDSRIDFIIPQSVLDAESQDETLRRTEPETPFHSATIRASGRVVNATTGQPITRFEVCISWETLQRSRAARPEASLLDRGCHSVHWERDVYYVDLSDEKPTDSFAFASGSSYTSFENPEGRFAVKGTHYVKGYLIVRTPGHFLEEIELPETLWSDVRIDDLMVRMTACPALEGVVKGPDGQSLANARVFGENDTPDVRTDTAGRFRIDSYPKDLPYLKVSCPGLAMGCVKLDAANWAQGPFLVELRPAATVRISVRGWFQGVEDLWAELQSEALPFPLKSDPLAGTLEAVFDNVPAGCVTVTVYEIGVSCARMLDHTLAVGVEEGKTALLGFDVPVSSACVEGTVLRGGRPAVSGQLSLSTADKTVPTQIRAFCSFEPDGSFRIAHLPAGSYELSVTLTTEKGVTYWSNHPVTLSEGEHIRKDIDIPAGTSSIVGRVPPPLPKPGCRFIVDILEGHVAAGEGEAMGCVEVGKDGVFQVDQLPVGTYTLRLREAEDPGVSGEPKRQWETHQTVQLEDSKEAVVEFML